MQVLDHQPDTRSWSDSSGHYIECYGIGTKYNEAKWKINKETGHEKVQKFPGHHFAVIPELIQKPLSEGGGGHYFGLDTKDDLLQGYAANSHGVIERLKGPYSYNDGTNDYFYNFVIKLRDSKAAAALVQHGANTWVPYSVSPHIWPISGPDHDIQDWEPIGAALVIKGAYGPQAIISKMCKGTAVQCEKSLGASSMTMKEAEERHYDHINNVMQGVSFEKLCGQKDGELAEIITSLVSKSASIQTSMPENKEASPPVVTELKTTTVETPKPNTTVDSQMAITNAAQLSKVVTAEEFAASEKEKAELKKQVTQLLNDKKNNELTAVINEFAGVSDEKRKTAFVEKWFKKEVDIAILKEFYNDIKTEIAERRKKASEQGEEEQEDEDNKDKPQVKAKSKSASLPKEPELPKEESKAASVPVNKLREIIQFQMSGGRA